jgi:hypothetical protein
MSTNQGSDNPANLLLEDLRVALASVAKIDKYEREKFKNAEQPRYVWVPVGGAWGPPQAPGKNPRNLARWACRIDVAIFAKDDDQAYQLAHALLTAVEKRLGGRSNYSVPDVSTANPAWLTRGVLWGVQLVVNLNVREAALPDLTGEPVTDNELAEVQPIAAEQEDPPLSVAGDGVLEGTEQ